MSFLRLILLISLVSTSSPAWSNDSIESVYKMLSPTAIIPRSTDPASTIPWPRM
jgi:hypothetical protein